MSRKFSKVLALLLVVMLIVPMTVSFAAESSLLPDTRGNWAEKEIKYLYEKDIVKGFPDGLFYPNNEVTRAQFAAFINRVFDFTEIGNVSFVDVTPGAWYMGEISRAVAAGYLQGDGNGHVFPNRTITRQEAAVMLARAFDIKASNPKATDKFADAADIANWSLDSINAMVERGYLNGKPGNKMAPKDTITRAEAAKMINNITGEIYNVAGTYSGELKGNVIVNKTKVNLKDMVVEGDLYIAEGVGRGDVTLNNVTVKGNVIVRGGGENSIILNNSNVQGNLVVTKKDGKIRVVAMGNTEVANVTLRSGAKLQEEGLTGKGFDKVEVMIVTPGQAIVLDGNFESVTIEVPNVTLNIASGTIGEVKVNKEAVGSTISISKDVIISTLTVDSSLTVKGQGKIETANVNVNNVTMEIKPTNINVATGVKVQVEGKEVTSTTTPGTSPQQPSTGGGGGDTTPGGGTQPIAVTGITINLGGISQTVGNNQAIFSLALKSDIDRFSGITLSTTPSGAINGASLEISQINARGLNLLDSAITVSVPASGSVTAKQLLGDMLPNNDVSLATLRSLFGSGDIILTGKLTREGYTFNGGNNITIRITLGSSTTGTLQSTFSNEYMIIEKTAPKTATVTIKSGKETITIGELNTMGVNLPAIIMAVVESGVEVSGGSIENIDALKQAILGRLNANVFNIISLDQLVGKTISFNGYEVTFIGEVNTI